MSANDIVNNTTVFTGNICHKVIFSRSDIPEFVEFVSNYDILCFTETKMDESDNMSTLLPGHPLFFLE